MIRLLFPSSTRYCPDRPLPYAGTHSLISPAWSSLADGARLVAAAAVATPLQVDDFLTWATLESSWRAAGYVLFYQPSFYFSHPP